MKRFIKRVLAVLAVLATGGLLGAVVGEVVDQGRDLDASVRERQALAGDVEVLREQVKDLGATPDVGPPGAVGERGERGPRGLPGRDGRDATPEQIAAAVASWLRLNPPLDQPDPDDPEVQDEEIQDEEIQDPEEQEAEIQDPEVDDPEVQDPEVDDPDPGTPGDGDCPAGYSLRPSRIQGDEVLVCTRDAA